MLDTFTPRQLTEASMYYLQPERGTTPAQIGAVIRDRAMLLATTTMAFRGDNIRRIKWSDISIRDTLLPDIGPKFYAPVRTPPLRHILSFLTDTARRWL